MIQQLAPRVGISPSTQNFFSQKILVWAPTHGNFLLKISHSVVLIQHESQAVGFLRGAQKIKIPYSGIKIFTSSAGWIRTNDQSLNRRLRYRCATAEC